MKAKFKIQAKQHLLKQEATAKEKIMYTFVVKSRAIWQAQQNLFSSLTLITLGILLTVGLTACGGGGSDDPVATIPDAPTAVTATAGDAQATVDFTAPANTGGSAITGYTVTSSPAGGIDANAGSTALSHTITGLTNFTSYTFTAIATNTVGGSLASAASNAITPAVIVVQNQTATQDSYDAVSTSLPGNNLAGGYEFGPAANWWGGVGTDSVYRGVGVTSPGTGAGVGVDVAGTGANTWNINGASSLTVGLGTNQECVDICKATIVLLSSNTACKATSNNPITMLRVGVNTGLNINTGAGATVTTASTYTLTLGDVDWAVTGCATNTMTSFLTLPLKEVHAQLLAADMQFAVAGDNANGINLGGIRFQ